mmetsp:Transcript_17375/g.25864  ORF Transcript_17375/g.25864 Transcript_17375/m.25864 type:complete len:87 (-) Transcript_17375:927-1187(-)
MFMATPKKNSLSIKYTGMHFFALAFIPLPSTSPFKFTALHQILFQASPSCVQQRKSHYLVPKVESETTQGAAVCIITNINRIILNI